MKLAWKNVTLSLQLLDLIKCDIQRVEYYKGRSLIFFGFFWRNLCSFWFIEQSDSCSFDFDKGLISERSIKVMKVAEEVQRKEGKESERQTVCNIRNLPVV